MLFLKNIKCNRYQKLLLPYLEDKLSKENRLTLENHLQDCVHCQAELKLVSNISGALKSSAPEPSLVQDNLWQNIKSEITKEPSRSHNFYLKPASVALAFVIVIGIFAGLRFNDMKEKPEIINHITASKPAPSKLEAKQNIIKEKSHRPFVSIAEVKTDKSSTHKTKKITRINKPEMMAKLPEDIKNESLYMSKQEPSGQQPLFELKDNNSILLRAGDAPEAVDKYEVKSDQSQLWFSDQLPSKTSDRLDIKYRRGDLSKQDSQASDMLQLQASPQPLNDIARSKQSAGAGSEGMEASTGLQSANSKALAACSRIAPASAIRKESGKKTDVQTLLDRLDKELADKDNSAALKTIDNIISLGPKEQSVWFKIASAYEALNEKDKAVNAYKTAMNGPDESIKKEAKEKLSAIE